jgi:TRAP-type C4-dicarboxylate transport system substrate-binding protein
VITNNGRPVVRPEDLRGIKLRTPKDPERVKLFKLLGASPTSMAFGELFTALRQGVVDGQENPLSQIVSARLYEVQTYLSLSRHVYSPAYPLMSRRFFDSLPEDVRRRLRDIAVEVGDFHRERGEILDAEYLAECRKYLQVTEIDRAAFEAASAPLYDEFTRRHGPELVDSVRAAAASADAPSPQSAPGEKARAPR